MVLLKSFFLVLVALATLVGSQMALFAEDGTAMVLETDPTALVVTSTAGAEIRFQIEVADTPFERRQGLMFRKNMPDDHGMLFEFGETRQIAMWMKNTYLPLDMVFIGADGKINAIRQAIPHSLDIVAPETQSRFVLELNAGIAEKYGVDVGATIQHPVVDAIVGGG